MNFATLKVDLLLRFSCTAFFYFTGSGFYALLGLPIRKEWKWTEPNFQNLLVSRLSRSCVHCKGILVKTAACDMIAYFDLPKGIGRPGKMRKSTDRSYAPNAQAQRFLQTKNRE